MHLEYSWRAECEISAPVSVGSDFDHKARRVRSVYRDTKPKTTAVLARLLQDTFGVAGLTVAHLERYEIDKLRNEKQALYDSLGNFDEYSLCILTTVKRNGEKNGPVDVSMELIIRDFMLQVRTRLDDGLVRK